MTAALTSAAVMAPLVPNYGLAGYAVYLTEAERAQLRTLIGCGEAPARMLTHARILLKADQGEGGPGWSDAAIAGALEVHPDHRRPRPPGVRRSRAGGRPGAQGARPRVPRTLDGAAEAHLIAVACSAPPAGRERWTLRLLADELVRLEVVETVSYETVRRTLKQTSSSRG